MSNYDADRRERKTIYLRHTAVPHISPLFCQLLLPEKLNKEVCYQITVPRITSDILTLRYFVRSYVTIATMMIVITVIPANIPSPTGSTRIFLPGIANACWGAADAVSAVREDEEDGADADEDAAEGDDNAAVVDTAAPALLATAAVAVDDVEPLPLDTAVALAATVLKADVGTEDAATRLVPCINNENIVKN
jgi:hypothetical protein